MPIEKRLTAIELRQNGLKEDITAICYNQEVSNAKLEALSEDVNKLHRD